MKIDVGSCYRERKDSCNLTLLDQDQVSGLMTLLFNSVFITTVQGSRDLVIILRYNSTHLIRHHADA